MPSLAALSFDYLLVRFIVYAFLGWIIESTYKTLGQRRGFINSGFLHGPIVPIYGFGAVMMVVLEDALYGLSLPLEVLAFTLVCTAFEYLVGFLYETVFRIKLWDYSARRFNLHGRVCLKNTFLWALLVLAFILYIEPAVDRLIAHIPALPVFRWLAYGIGAVALADAAWSTAELKSTAELINRFRERFVLGDPEAIRSAMKALNARFLAQFPNLRKLASESFQSFIAEAFGVEAIGLRDSESLLFAASRIVKARGEGQAEMDPEYRDAVKDLLADEHVRSMAKIDHHDGSVLDHALRVSQVSFLLARRYGLDARATARGALLHDFFLYDWRREKVPHHATHHARTALENAKKYFQLGDIEADCILTHMWPLSKGFYRYRESFVVSLVDKLVSARELAGVDFPELLRQLVEKRLSR